MIALLLCTAITVYDGAFAASWWLAVLMGVASWLVFMCLTPPLMAALRRRPTKSTA
jgi:hypothetical protein